MTIEAIFRNTQYFVGPYFDGTVVIYKEWPQWQKDWWYAFLPPPTPPAWKPTFEQGMVAQITDGNGNTTDVLLNHESFATEATCRELMRRFKFIGFASVPFQGMGGFTSGTARERWIVDADGITAHNAGTLARYFEAYPEDKNPGYAHSKVVDDMEVARRNGQKLPSTASPIAHVATSAVRAARKKKKGR